MSSEIIQAKTRTVRFFACGGTGIDLLRSYREGARLEHADIRAVELDSYIDTSDSNMFGISTENVYRIKNTEGGGKDREKVKAAVIPVLSDILLKHPAGDLNVVVFSNSGGTGSAIGPLMAGYLLKAGHPTCCIILADHTSSKAISNNINATADLESVCRQLKKPVVIHYTKNDPSKSHLENDTVPLFVMGALSILGSGKNTKQDLSDIQNFFNYPAVTHHQSSLARLSVSFSVEDLKDVEPVAAFAALLRSEDQALPTLPVNVDYDTVGFLPSGSKGYDRDFFFAVTPGIDDIVDELLEQKRQLELKHRVTESRSSLLDENSTFDGNSGINLF